VGYRKADDRKEALNADYIIHLAGANIAEKPWTNKRKEQIINSRNSLAYLPV
jgi:NAD dependent epimerase/dehydratase family enzyme